MGIMRPSTPPNQEPPDPPDADFDENLNVHYWRYRTARKAGFSFKQSQAFAESDADIGALRRLVAQGVVPSLIARILL